MCHQQGLNADGTDDGFIPLYCAKNRTQHQTLLGEFPLGRKDTTEMLKRFLILPLFLDLGGLRLIRACEDDVRAIAFGNLRIKKVNIRRTFWLSRCVRSQVLMILDPDATLQTQKRFP